MGRFDDHATVPPPRDPRAERVAPHNLEAERSVLGAILLHNHAFNLAAEVIDSNDFFRDAHRRIFDKMGKLAARNEPIDLVTLKEELGRSGDLDEVGGPAYISALIDGVPQSTNVEHYAKIIKEKATLRSLIFSANKILATAYAQGDENAAAIIEAATRDIGGLAQSDASTSSALLETLRDRLARPRVPLQFRIPQWQPSGSRAMLAAQFKAGKTTLVGNVVRPLVDGGLFLGRHHVMPIDGSVVLLDFEMSELQLDDWLAAQQIRNDDRVVVIAMRGRASSFDILSARTRAEWARRLRDVNAQYLVWDCVRPLMDALGLDEHSEAGRLLVAFDELLAGAGIPDALVVHHMGHGGERSRGDSRLRDWPDVEWRLVRKDADDPASPRFLSAYGRDVDVSECQLEFDVSTRHLSIAGGSRRDAKTEAALEAVVGVLRTAPGALSGREVKRELRDSDHGRNVIDAALKLGEGSGAIIARTGLRNARLYAVGAVSVSASLSVPSVSRDAVVECPAAFIRRDTEHSIQERSVSRSVDVVPPCGISPEAWAANHQERQP